MNYGMVGQRTRAQRTIMSAVKTGSSFLRLLPPEFAHRVAVQLLKTPLAAGFSRFLPPSLLHQLATEVIGLGKVTHPIGLAAGFDKSAQCFRGLAHLGFSLIEVGTITPRPQAGNPRPRLFRLPEQRALINRMGFNNHGIEVVGKRLGEAAAPGRSVLLGINIGINKTTLLPRALDDYLAGLRGLGSHGDYLVVNISSPNTPNLRSLAHPNFLRELARAVTSELGREILAKLWIKLDPDLERRSFQALVAAMAEAPYAGLIATNTHRVSNPEAGGLSGHPLAIASTTCLEWAWEVHRGAMPMVGSGGVFSGEDIFQKLIRGASCVQIYTAMIYRGPWVVWELLEELAEAMRLRGFTRVDELRGSYYREGKIWH